MSDTEDLPKIRPLSSPMDVPVFNIVIYISKQQGKVVARVANLPDLVFRGATEPMALKQAITEVKSRLTQWHGSGESIPWIDPAPEPTDEEQQRLVPVHL